MPKKNTGRLVQVALFCFLIMVGGCGKQDQLIQSPVQQQVKSIDFVVPVGFSRVQYSASSNHGLYSDFSCYRGRGTVASTLSFYKREFDRLGWDIHDLSCEARGVLVCKKHAKEGVLFIKPTSNSSVIVEYVERPVVEQ